MAISSDVRNPEFLTEHPRDKESSSSSIQGRRPGRRPGVQWVFPTMASRRRGLAHIASLHPLRGARPAWDWRGLEGTGGTGGTGVDAYRPICLGQEEATYRQEHSCTGSQVSLAALHVHSIGGAMSLTNPRAPTM